MRAAAVKGPFDVRVAVTPGPAVLQGADTDTDTGADTGAEPASATAPHPVRP